MESAVQNAIQNNVTFQDAYDVIVVGA
ncbi:MAG: hypothetical protein RLZZ29_893, partial [Cyanobacteriota bacterium]